MPEHTVKSYDSELASLRTMLAQMGGLAEDQLAKAIEALARRDIKLADQVVTQDEKVDTLEWQLEERAILILARRQPMAHDLREVMVSIRIAADLERVGDLAKNVAKRVQAISDQIPRRLSAGLTRMGKLSLAQLNEVLDAYSSRSDAKALEVWRSDEEIDALYNSIFRELLTYMMEDPRMIGPCTHLLFGAKNFERIGDHATNIAENVYYLVNGRAIKEERPKKDLTSTTSFEATR